ncbi:hypothetical protein NRB14_14165, partial [Pseudomonas viridiflava]|nr:hypothetical protein [Pseudomonas viridiflava]
MSDIRTQDYYHNQSYCPETIPEQKPCVRHKSFGSSSVRLPWGSTQQVASDGIMGQSPPKSMRFWENTEKEKSEGTYIPQLFEGVDLHQKYDQERFRFAQLPFTSQFWIFLLLFGKWGFIIIFPLTAFAHAKLISVSYDSWQVVTLEALKGLYPVLTGIPLLF